MGCWLWGPGTYVLAAWGGLDLCGWREKEGVTGLGRDWPSALASSSLGVWGSEAVVCVKLGDLASNCPQALMSSSTSG